MFSQDFHSGERASVLKTHKLKIKNQINHPFHVEYQAEVQP
jgi:hypothetical protein